MARDAQHRRHRLDPAPDSNQAPETHGSPRDHARDKPGRDKRGQHSQHQSQARDPDPGQQLAWSNDYDLLPSAGV